MNLNQKTVRGQRFEMPSKVSPLFKKIFPPTPFAHWIMGLCCLFLCLFLFSTNLYADSSIQPQAEKNNLLNPLSNAQTAVGHVQFVIGRHVQIMRSHKTIEATIGAPLYSEDALMTGTNSFIHVKMVDDALISLRPQSHLTINCYQDATEQGESCLKFTLLKGQVRKVSGKAGKASPTKYRLNTPVAAIGIRGTDYIASVQDGTSLVKVMQGAISVSPFIEGCTAQGFGECHTSLTALLTEHDTYMLRILAEQMPEPVTEDLQAYTASFAQESNVNKDNDESAPPEKLMEAEAPILKDNEDLIAQFIQQANISTEEYLIENGLKNSPPNMLVPVLKSQVDLVFGTWSPYADGIAIPYSEAKQGRDITIGGIEGALWRSEGAYRPPEGRVDYSLTGSHAYVMNGDQLTSAEVVSGSMSIDFDQKLLATKMTIEPSNMRIVEYQASHNLTRSDGVFANNTATGRVGEGAISNDGSQVGYRLQQPVERGMLHADTLWQAIQAP